MKRKSKLRKLRVESLERRVMLDGNVIVSVAGGVLLVTGDAKSNVITISSPTPGGGTTFPGTLSITPDATTSINNGVPGASVQVSGVINGAQIVLGSGDDVLTFQESTGLVGPVSIQTGAGSDQIKMVDFTFSKISVTSQGNCAIDLSNTTVQQSLILKGGQGNNSATLEDDTIGVPPASGAPLTLISLSSTNFGLSLQRTSVGRSIQATSDKRGGSVALDTCTVGGGVTVTSAGGLSFTATDSTCSAGCSLKFDSSTASSPATVDMEQGSLGGGLSIQGRGAMTIIIKKFDFTREGITVDNSASSARSSINETDVDCGGSCAVSATAPLDFSATDLTAGSCTLSIDNSKHQPSESNISLQYLTIAGGLFVTAQDAASLSLTASPQSPSQIGSAQIALDNSDLAAASPQAKLHIEDSVGGGALNVACRGAFDLTGGDLQASNIVIKLDGIKGGSVTDSTSMDDITVTGGISVTSSIADQADFEHIKFKSAAISLSDASGARSSVTIDDASGDGAVSITAHSPADVSVSGLQASSLSLQLDGIKGSSLVENCTLDQITLTGGLTITSSAAQDLSVNSASLNFTKIIMKYNGAARSSVSVGDVNSDGRMDITCAGATDVTAHDISSSDFSLALGGIKGALVTETTDVERVTVTGGLTITCATAQDLTASSLSYHTVKLRLADVDGEASTVGLADLDGDGVLDVACASPADLTASGVQSSDFLLEMDGIKGSSLVENCTLDQITLTGGLTITSSAAQDLSVDSASLNFTKIIMKYSGAARSSVAIGDVNADGRMDISCAGATDAAVHDVSASDFSLTLNGIKGTMVTETTDLERITVTGGLFVTCGTAEQLTASSLRGQYVKIRLADVDQGDSSVAIGDVNGDGVLDIACASPADVSVDTVQAGSMLLNLAGIKGSSAVETTDLTGITLTGGLTVSSSAVQNMTLDGFQGQSITMKLDNSSLASRSSVSVADLDMDGRMDVVTTGAIDVQASSGAIHAPGSGNFSLSFAALFGQTSPSSLSIDDMTLDGNLSVTSVGGLTFNVGQGSSSSTGAVGTSSGLQANGLTMKISDVSGPQPMPTTAMLADLVLASLYIQTGKGDDTVSISDSQVSSSLYLNGGLGNDTLILDNTDFSFVSNPLKISWETIELK